MFAKNIRVILIFFSLLFLISCSEKRQDNIRIPTAGTSVIYIPMYHNYLQDSNVSDRSGIPKYTKRLGYTGCNFYHTFEDPKRTLALLPSVYLPFAIKKDSEIIHTKLDSCNAEGYTMEMVNLQEPVLYNYYLGKDIIRMYFNSALKLLVQTDLTREDNKVIMKIRTNNADGTIAQLPNKEFSMAEWDTVLTLMNRAGFWNLIPRQLNNNTYEDGYKVIIEAHMKDSYWFVIWENEGVLDELMNYIRVDLADLKQSIWAR